MFEQRRSSIRAKLPTMNFALVILLTTPLLSQQPSSANAPAEQQVTPGVATAEE